MPFINIVLNSSQQNQLVSYYVKSWMFSRPKGPYCDYLGASLKQSNTRLEMGEEHLNIILGVRP